MNIANRIILLIAGLGLAWCAVWIGGDMQLWAWPATAARNDPMLLFLVFFAIAFYVGQRTTGEFIETIHKDTPLNNVDSVMDSIVHLVCFAFIYGAIVAPIGSGVGAWVTPWDFLLILGLVPLIFVLKEVIADIFRVPDAKEVPASEATITKLHQR